MVVVYSCAGLANKMFHYAFYKALELKGEDVYLDVDSYIVDRWNFENIFLTDVFDNVHYRKSTKFKRAARRTLFDKVYTHLSSFFGGAYYINWGFKYDKNVFSKSNDSYCLVGNWQSEQYFIDIKDEIYSAFQFKPFLDERNREISRKMANENSVAIHVRKGLSYQQEVIFDGTCPIEYYQRAILYMKEHVKNPVFYVFTDNKEWVLKHFTDFDYTLCDWNPTSGKLNYLDMQLMSSAKHNIIANSTYSWWGAWLNKNSQKIVIAPALWFNPINKLYSQVEIVPKDWIAI